MSDNTNNALSDIDRAIAAAKARKEAKRGAGEGSPARNSVRMSEEERAAKLAERERDRAERLAKREQERSERIAAREAAKKPAHMKKALKMAERLAPLGQDALLIFNEATANLSAAELACLAGHIVQFNREKAIERAASVVLEPGTPVRIVSGDPRFVGKVGNVFKANRVRCYVAVDGTDRQAYLYTSDVEVLEASEEADEEHALASGEEVVTPPGEDAIAASSEEVKVEPSLTLASSDEAPHASDEPSADDGIENLSLAG